MSRKWERMVEKNRKQLNERKMKQGDTPLNETPDGSKIFKGRSWIFPLVLASAGILFAFTIPQGSSSDALYIITIALYFLLALFHYYVRRPFLKIGKKYISWRTYRGEKFYAPSDIEAIFISDRQVQVFLKGGKASKTFSRLYHLFPMDKLSESLRAFAHQHQIPLNVSMKE